jgi:hypothetical protein
MVILLTMLVLRADRPTEIGTYVHPFQGDAVSPILSDDGSINKVWIGMAGCLGSV